MASVITLCSFETLNPRILFFFFFLPALVLHKREKLKITFCLLHTSTSMDRHLPLLHHSLTYMCLLFSTNCPQLMFIAICILLPLQILRFLSDCFHHTCSTWQIHRLANRCQSDPSCLHASLYCQSRRLLAQFLFSSLPHSYSVPWQCVLSSKGAHSILCLLGYVQQSTLPPQSHFEILVKNGKAAHSFCF